MMQDDLKTALKDIAAFAVRYGLDIAELLLSIYAVKSGETVGERFNPKTDSFSSHAQHEHHVEPAHATATVDATVLTVAATMHILKQFWLSQPEGYRASARDIYNACGLEHPHSGRRLSYWLVRDPKAKAVVIDDGSRLQFMRTDRPMKDMRRPRKH